MSKPKIGIFGFTGCSGCQLQILNLEDVILDIIELVDIVHFRMAKRENIDGKYDVAFVEGSIDSKDQIPDLMKIRENAKILIALGTCACFGGVQSMRNFIGLNKAKRIVYGNDELIYDFLDTKPISSYVKVDYCLPGCPIDKDEFVEVVKSLLIGKKLIKKKYPVCVECKMKEIVCLCEKGEICMGPVTVGGCNAICPTYGKTCEGCRGPVEEANISSEINIMKEHGIKIKDIMNRFRKYGSFNQNALEDVKL